MENKEIYVDGIDVSKCQDFYIYAMDNSKCCNCESDNTQCVDCKDNPNCYFKQLSRKTQEYELLVRTNKIHIDMLDQLNNKYIDKEQECEKLKKKNEILQNRNQQLDGAITEASRYRKALEEIENIKEVDNAR